MFITSALGTSILAGLFTAAWGAYKDAPYERFSHASFWRSVIAATTAILVAILYVHALFA